jgi:hypothetical protein
MAPETMSVTQNLRANLNAPLRTEDVKRYAKIAAIVAPVILAWAQLNYKLDAAAKDAHASLERGERIERYLSSKDPSYWQTVKSME